MFNEDFLLVMIVDADEENDIEPIWMFRSSSSTGIAGVLFTSNTQFGKMVTPDTG
jgi:hypothetical protein